MIALRAAASDDDLEAWRGVKAVVAPNERVPELRELRAWLAQGRLFLLAEEDGEVRGSGYAGPSDMAGRGYLVPRVLPAVRRRGIGAALLGALAAHLAGRGYERVGASVEDAGSLAFAARFGFAEVDRQVEQVRAIGRERRPDPPAGIDIVSVAERPELWRAAYETVGAQAFEDMAVDQPLAVALEQWETEWIGPPEAMFLALAGGEVVGCAGLHPDPDRPERAENALTAVRRDRRGQGIALALKRAALAWGAENGIREVYTWTQRGNGAMRALNERLGYVTRTESVSLRARLPLQAE